MLEKFQEEDLYNCLLKMFAQYPFNDIVHRYITNIISFALDHKIGKELYDKGLPPKRTNRFLDLEQIKSDDEAQRKEEEETKEDEKGRRDMLLVHILFSTSLVEIISDMCLNRAKMSFGATSKQSTEVGYVAHL